MGIAAVRGRLHQLDCSCRRNGQKMKTTSAPTAALHGVHEKRRVDNLRPRNGVQSEGMRVANEAQAVLGAESRPCGANSRSRQHRASRNLNTTISLVADSVS
jgi:hypothetical protein